MGVKRILKDAIAAVSYYYKQMYWFVEVHYKFFKRLEKAAFCNESDADVHTEYGESYSNTWYRVSMKIFQLHFRP